jgi:hypothetical protein
MPSPRPGFDFQENDYGYVAQELANELWNMSPSLVFVLTPSPEGISCVSKTTCTHAIANFMHQALQLVGPGNEATTPL